MVRSKVAVIKRRGRETTQEAVWRALDLIGAVACLSPFESFLLKPNYVIDRSPMSGLTTRPDSLDGIVTYLLRKVGKTPDQVLIGEGGDPSSTESAFTTCGARDLAEKHGVRLVNLNEDEKESVALKDSLSLKAANVARTARSMECVISVPTLKTHSMAVTTLAMKNCMGCIMPKGIMHSSLHKKIADLAGLINPGLSVIDGIIGAEGNEVSGDPVPMGLIVAGTDYVAVDTVGSAVMGYSPEECEYLQYGAEQGLGTCDLSKIDVLGVSIEDVKRKFHR
jgi:uncharacterized protein (DUF362 family)